MMKGAHLQPTEYVTLSLPFRLANGYSGGNTHQLDHLSSKTVLLLLSCMSNLNSQLQGNNEPSST